MFCIHHWKEIAFVCHNENNIRRTSKKVKCTKCGKEEWIDL